MVTEWARAKEADGVQARRRSFPVSGERFSVGRVLRALRGATLGLVVPAIIIGGILGGASRAIA